MMELRAQTGPVFLTYRATHGVDVVVERMTSQAPLFDFTAPDGVQHTSGAWMPISWPISSRRSGGSRRSTSPTGIIARRAPRARGSSCAGKRRTGRMGRPCWRWRSQTTRCRSCRTTACQGSRRADAGGAAGDAARALRGAAGSGRRRSAAAKWRCFSTASWHTIVLGEPAHGLEAADRLDVSRAAGHRAVADARHRRRAHRQAD